MKNIALEVEEKQVEDEDEDLDYSDVEYEETSDQEEAGPSEQHWPQKLDCRRCFFFLNMIFFFLPDTYSFFPFFKIWSNLKAFFFYMFEKVKVASGEFSL